MLIDKSRDTIALDRASARAFDQDGHLNVTGCRISKATVNPYYGREIPNAASLGLDGEKIYQVLRPAEALEAAASTFEGKPLLDEHRPVTAEDHDPEKVVGAIRNVRFEPPFLVADLSVWDGDAIKDIQSGSKKELSCGYRYSPVLESGVFEGHPYDLRMADIAGNHLALVHEGRAGPECVVGDSSPVKKDWFMPANRALTRRAVAAQGALLAYLRPKMAADAKIDLSPVLISIGKTFDAAALARSVNDATAGKLAQDAALDGLLPLLTEVAGLALDEDDDDDEKKEKKAEDEDPDEKDDDKDKKAQDKAKDEDPDDEDDKDEDKISKSAMDAAIKAAAKAAEDRAIRRQRDIREAERFVRPWVGDLAVVHDSAEGVYRAALTTLGVNVGKVHPDALRPILEAQPKPGEQVRRAGSSIAAMDAAASDEYLKMFPNAGRLNA